MSQLSQLSCYFVTHARKSSMVVQWLAFLFACVGFHHQNMYNWFIFQSLTLTKAPAKIQIRDGWDAENQSHRVVHFLTIKTPPLLLLFDKHQKYQMQISVWWIDVTLEWGTGKTYGSSKSWTCEATLSLFECIRLLLFTWTIVVMKIK